ncbi:alpha/beta fold hydrolase [Pigmentiphaga soli]|uniref:Alpha/beta fold hydrolase n=1 Tax=Pigmentiphaga soli TaxID=1007095 RepID=A0ABP8GBU0_9BURK
MNSSAEPFIDLAAVAAADRDIARYAASLDCRDVPYDGGTVRWYGAGQGSPLVLFHGGHGRWLHWIRNVDALAASHRVWVPDLPAFGASSTLPPPESLPQLVQAAIATLDQLVGADTEIGLTGFSFGGVAAANVALQRGGVSRLALLGSGGHGTPRRQQLPMLSWRDAAGEADMLSKLHNNLRSLMLHDEAAIDAQALAIHRDACLNTRFRSKGLSQGGSAKAVVAQLRMPMLLLWGEHDVTAEPAVAIAAMGAGRPERRGEVIAGAGHWAQYERAEAVNRALLAFFD